MQTSNTCHPHHRKRFHLIMLTCLAFTAAMIGALIFVVSRPQTAQVQAAEQHAIAKCRQRSGNPERTAIYRATQVQACNEMEKQYRIKFGKGSDQT
ncbi:hypothetical protein E9531_15315 [Lampropedia puyangensis]|uniref:Uncharacterized protein n=1 Tax=Lampropedia puyangensis TaxID=1330072 RepID=A0A4S8ETS4_9BURK|nr:hypothetical protein [Lampropedia puyangensis]THT97818.1 hypothetical protein E9531_15315 [Lampropedia puyangensis]